MAVEDELQSSINKLNEAIQKIQKVADNANSLAASLNTENNTIVCGIMKTIINIETGEEVISKGIFNFEIKI